MTMGEKLAKLRKEHNLTQEQFAEIIKVSRQSVSKWEVGTTYPDTEKLIRISKLFDCSLDYLLKDEIEKTKVTTDGLSDESRYEKIWAVVLTYLSFPPLFGWIVGLISLRFQRKHIKSKIQITITILGMVFSITLTTLMILGAILGL